MQEFRSQPIEEFLSLTNQQTERKEGRKGEGGRKEEGKKSERGIEGDREGKKETLSTIS